MSAKKKRLMKKKRKIKFNTITNFVRKHLRSKKFKTLKDAILIAIKAASKTNKQKNVQTSRLVAIPKTGGILPLIPIFAGLSALDALTGDVSRPGGRAFGTSSFYSRDGTRLGTQINKNIIFPFI